MVQFYIPTVSSISFFFLIDRDFTLRIFQFGDFEYLSKIYGLSGPSGKKINNLAFMLKKILLCCSSFMYAKFPIQNPESLRNFPPFQMDIFALNVASQVDVRKFRQTRDHLKSVVTHIQLPLLHQTTNASWQRAKVISPMQNYKTMSSENLCLAFH